jgi:hypothetical protein
MTEDFGEPFTYSEIEMVNAFEPSGKAWAVWL